MSVFKRFRRHRVGFIDKHVDRDPGNAACIHQNVTKRLDKSMLGYDWIAGMLDNEQQIEDLSDEFFQDISKFRRKPHGLQNVFTSQEKQVCDYLIPINLCFQPLSKISTSSPLATKISKTNFFNNTNSYSSSS